MQRLVKPLFFLVAVLNAFNILLFTYCGLMAIHQRDFMDAVKCALLLVALCIAEVICILGVTE